MIKAERALHLASALFGAIFGATAFNEGVQLRTTFVVALVTTACVLVLTGAIWLCIRMLSREKPDTRKPRHKKRRRTSPTEARP